MAYLKIEHEGEKFRFDLKKEGSTIGRHPENTIQLPVGTVSGKHAEINFSGSRYMIRDVGSRNGTSVNGESVASDVPLKNKDQIAFGDAIAVFYDDSPDALRETVDAKSNPQIPKASDSSSSLFPALNLEIMSSGFEKISGAVDGSGSRFGALEAKPEAKLKAILEISTSLAGSIDLDAMLPKILDTLFGIFKLADRGCILLRDDVSGELVPRVIKHRRSTQDESVRLSRTVLDMVMQQRKAIRSADAAVDEMFSSSESIADMRIRSMMCAPMLSLSGEPIGAISIDSLNPLGQFTDGDLDLLLAVAGQAALSYETARLMASFVAKQKQDTEMQIAQSVQRALLPETLPAVEGYEFFASYDAAQAVGGDYYDVITLPDGRICVSFGDVAGKGVPGALIMSRMHSCVQNTLAHVHDVQKAILAINDHMCSSSVEGRFVTYILAIIDPHTHQLQTANAGHMPPLIRHSDGRIEHFDDELVGPPIGVVEDYPYEVETRQLEPGDMVLIVTDGVDEAMNHAGDLYTGERVVDFLKKDFENAAELGELLLEDVRRHANGRPQNDDITIFAFGRLKQK
jgi:serine phosphatase RsbU (regulator of sigma subunit)/pSer/pThr/pTyr-binding forkhead associated (FHA) protein